jgi:hypothetical protein
MFLMMVELAFNNTAGTAPGKRRRCHKLHNKSFAQQPADEDNPRVYRLIRTRVIRPDVASKATAPLLGGCQLT